MTRTHQTLLHLAPVVLLALAASSPGMAQTGGPPSFEVGSAARDEARPDVLAPIGVTQDRLQAKGDWLISYRYGLARLDGLRDGVERVRSGAVTSPGAFGFQTTPTEQTVETHTFAAAFAPTDALTLIALVPFLEQEMQHVTRAGDRFRTQSSGLGDVTLAALVKVHEDSASRAHLNLGLGVPTGSIDEGDVTPGSAPAEGVLPYPMQLGSGTWDLRPGVTVVGHEEDWSWGGQAIATFRLGRNDRDYSLGDRYDMTAWAAYRATGALSVSARLALSHVRNVEGRDARLDAALEPTADPRLRAGTRLDALVGLNAHVGSGNRIAVEAGWPLHEDLEGPQLETDFVGTVGWQVSF